MCGDDGKKVTPVPISNTEVKTSSADGTASRGVWESRTPPGFFVSTDCSRLLFNYISIILYLCSTVNPN